jgi:hypothetical protein
VSTRDSFEVQVDWGDGSGVDTLYYPPGARSFSDQHTYGQESPAGGYPVSVTLTNGTSLSFWRSVSPLAARKR